MSTVSRTVLVCVLAAWATVSAGGAQTPPASVVFITLDGFRWQELFTGAEQALFEKSASGAPGQAEQRFWRNTAQARRTTLMPFFWNVVAKRGAVFGDPSAGSSSRVTNGLWFSYPGYSEMLSGVADPRVKSNDKIPNPNLTVLEWLNGRPEFRGRVAAFGAWDVLAFIVNVGRSRLPVGDGDRPVPDPRSDRERAINDLAADLPPYWAGAPFDAPIMQAALESLRTRHPRVLYVMLGETDEWAHEGRYDLYLDAASRSDRFIERVWTLLQSMPEYANKTTMVLTTDHGRGTGADWTRHGEKVPAAADTWMAVLGPGVSSPGVRPGVTVTTAQIAATVAAVVGQDFGLAVPAAAPPLPGVAAPR